MTEREAFIAAIAADPDDDTPRLVLADWLDEQPVERVTCPKCKGKGETRGDGLILSGKPCLACGGLALTPHSHRKGDGTVLDTSNRDLAEFVRVQCELAGCRVCPATIHHPRSDAPNYGGKMYVVPPPTVPKEPCGWCPVCVGIEREAALLAAHPEWRRCPCEDCAGTGLAVRIGSNPCPVCGGTGDLFRTIGMGTVQPRLTHFRRGFLDSVECRSPDVWREDSWLCPACDGTRRCVRCGGGARVRATVPTPWALAVVRQCPTLTRLVLTDREPFRFLDAPGKFGWDRDRPTYQGNPAEVLPPWLYDLFRPGDIYHSRDAARDALALAVAKWVRSHLPKPVIA